jgi:predicted  nucleic acid-binding Zn-ribbon protein
MHTAPRIVVWTDRWLNCSDGSTDYHRRWVSLDDTTLSVFYDPTDDHGPIQTLPLRGLQIENNPAAFTIMVYNDDIDLGFRCGEQLEFDATYAALFRRVTVANTRCDSCATLQKELEAAQHHIDRLTAQGASAADVVAARDALATVSRELEAAVAARRELESTVDAFRKRQAVLEERTLLAEAHEREAGARIKAAETVAAKCQTKLDSLCKQHDELQAKEAAVSTRLAGANDALTAAHAKLEAANAEGASQAQRSAELAGELTSTRAAANNHRMECDKLRGEALAQRQSLDEQKVALAALDDAHREALAKASAAERAVASKQAELDRATSRLQAADIRDASAERQRQVLADELVKVRAALATAREEAANHTTVSEAALKTLSSDKAAAESALAAARSELDEERAAAAVVAAEQRDCARELSNQVTALEARLSAEKAQADTLREGAAQHSARAADAQAKVLQLQAELERWTHRTFQDASVGTLPISDLLTRAPELATMRAAAAATEFAKDVTVLAHMFTRDVSATAVGELLPVVDHLRQSFAAKLEAAGKGEILKLAAELAVAVSSTASARDSNGSPQLSRFKSRGPDALTRDDRELLAALQALQAASTRIDSVLADNDNANSAVSRGYKVATAVGFLDSIRTLDNATNSLSWNHEFRDAVMAYLQGPATAARAAARELLAANRGQRNASLEALCRKLEADLAAVCDYCVRCAPGRTAADAAWRNGMLQATGQCTSLAHAIGKAKDTEPLDDHQRKADALGASVHALLSTESGQHNSQLVRDLVTSHAHLQVALFLAIRRRNRALCHHDAAESIARFGVALKRAGQILQQSKIRGSEPYADDCLVGWPIVAQLVALPRCLAEEDRAFARCYDALIATAHGTLIVPKNVG